MYAFNYLIPNIAKLCELSSDKLHNLVIKNNKYIKIIDKHDFTTSE